MIAMIKYKMEIFIVVKVLSFDKFKYLYLPTVLLLFHFMTFLDFFNFHFILKVCITLKK